MIELLELKNCIETGRYTQALTIIGEMEEMSREDKINKIYNFLKQILREVDEFFKVIISDSYICMQYPCRTVLVI